MPDLQRHVPLSTHAVSSKGGCSSRSQVGVTAFKFSPRPSSESRIARLQVGLGLSHQCPPSRPSSGPPGSGSGCTRRRASRQSHWQGRFATGCSAAPGSGVIQCNCEPDVRRVSSESGSAVAGPPGRCSLTVCNSPGLSGLASRLKGLHQQTGLYLGWHS
jgi:hypothetical protein